MLKSVCPNWKCDSEIVSQLYFKEEVWTSGLKITLNEHETALNVHELTMM